MLRSHTLHRLRTCRALLWLTLAVMLLGAAAPAVSRVLAAAQASSTRWVEVCTGAGPRWVALWPDAGADAAAARPQNFSSEAAPDGREAARLIDACPFCLLIADRLGPPPAASMHFFNADSGLVRPDAQALFFPSAPLGAAWARGPPTHA